MVRLGIALLTTALVAFWLGLRSGDADDPERAGRALATAREGSSPAGPAATPQAAGSAAILAAVDLPDDAGRVERLARLGAALAASGPEAIPIVRAIASGAASDPGPDEFAFLVDWWAGKDPEDAWLWSFREVPRAYRLIAPSLVAYRWGRDDPTVAVQRVVRAGSDSLDLAVSALVRGWYDSGEPGVDEWIGSMGFGSERQMALATLTQAMVRRDGAQTAIDWVESLPDAAQNSEHPLDSPDRFKNVAFRQVAGALGRHDAAAGIAFLERHRSGPYRAHLTKSFVVPWVARDGSAAMKWVTAQPADALPFGLVGDAFRVWLSRDRPRAVDWVLESEPEDAAPWQRELAGSFAMALVARSPQAALRWAERVDDPEKRDRAVVTIVRRWLRRDAEGAEAWLARGELDAALVERVRGKAGDPTDDT